MDGSAFWATSSSWSRFNEGSRRNVGCVGLGCVGLGAGAGRGGGAGAGPPQNGPGVLCAARLRGTWLAMEQKLSFFAAACLAGALVFVRERLPGCGDLLSGNWRCWRAVVRPLLAESTSRDYVFDSRT